MIAKHIGLLRNSKTLNIHCSEFTFAFTSLKLTDDDGMNCSIFGREINVLIIVLKDHQPYQYISAKPLTEIM